MSRNAALLAMVVLVATACDRNNTPDLVRGAGAPVPTAAAPPPPMAPSPSSEPPATTAGKSTGAKSKATSSRADRARSAAAGASSRAGPPSRDTVSDDPCAGLDGAELDDCLGFDAGDARNGQGGRDFASEQRQRDRALMERDAREAAERADAADEPPFDAGDDPGDPQDELPPDDYDQDPRDVYHLGDDEPPPDDDPGR